MQWGLRDDLRFCRVGDRTIFLDLRTERYFGLPAAADQAFRQFLAATPPSANDERELQPLIARGLLVPGGAAASSVQPPAKNQAEGDLRFALPDRVSPVIVALALRCELTAMLAARKQSLNTIASDLDRWRCGAAPEKDRSPTDLENYAALAAAFERIALLLRPADRCLIKAVAFLRACRSRNLFPSLVFGVRANPFAAHCWVQHHALVLNDELERVRIYTPILVL